MLVKVREHLLEIITTPVNEKEINITKITFDFPNSMDGFVKEAYFTLKGNTYKEIIYDNKCDIPGEVLEEKGQIELGVVAYKVENETIKRYNPSPVYFNTWVGSLKDAQNTEPITPSEMEQYENHLQEGLNEIDEAITRASNLDINATKTGTVATVTITHQDGSETEVEIYDGQKGDKGDTGERGERGERGLKGDTGERGPQGERGIQGIPGPTGPTGPKGDTGEPGTTDYNELDNKPTKLSDFTNDTGFITSEDHDNTKQDKLTAGANITIDANNIISASGGGGGSSTDVQINGTSITNNDVANIITKGEYNASTNKIATESDIPSVSGFITNTDYATDSVGGVLKTGNCSSLDSNGIISCATRDYATYSVMNNKNFISKGTLENVITGKGLVSNTDYANTTTGGVIKTGGGYGSRMDSNGNISASSYDYATYSTLGNYAFIGKGTLENVITGKGLLDSSKVKSTYTTTSGDVYDATYINSVIGNIETLLSEV